MASRPERSLDFVMSFVEVSQGYKDQFLPLWEEILRNFIVQPHRSRKAPVRDEIVLKDPETHKAVMTYVAKLTKALYGDRNGEYIQAQPVGWEDAFDKAPCVTRLLRRAFSLPGHFRTLVEATTDMILFGTSVVEVGWKYVEREMPVREIYMQDGIETDSVTRLRVPAYDDVSLSTVDLVDFFPDPGEYRIENMNGVAKRFKITALRARAMAAGGIYKSEAVTRAIGSNPVSNRGTSEVNWREDIDQPRDRVSMDDFAEMTGYEYWGDVPWSDDLGSSRRVITVINNVVVRDEPYPLSDPALPFHTFIINPLQGRFYGISPAEVIRYDQDFADALKMLTAEAVVRSVHPPIAFDVDGDLDVALLRRWRADMPIPIRGGPSAVGTIQYRADTMAGFNMQQMLTMKMQEASGAQGAIQGEPGPDREAASVGVQRISMAMDRPELAAMIIENECLPPIGAAILRRYQQFIPDTEDLRRRIGELPNPFWVGDIMGDYDIRFVGSRRAITREQKLQAYDRIIAMATAVPSFQLALPSVEMAKYIIGDLLQMPEVATRIGAPEVMMQNLAASMLMGGKGQSGNGNMQPQSSEFPGSSPAQIGGGPVDVG